MLIILILLLLVLFIVSYKFSNGDIISPPVLVTGGFLASAIFSLFMLGSLWRGKIDPDIVLIYSVGILLFMFAYYFVANQTKERNIDNAEILPIEIKNWKLAVYILLTFLSTYLYYKEIIQIVGSYGTSMEIMARFRLRSTYGTAIGTGVIRIADYITLSRMFLQGGTYIFVYVAANNMVCKHKNKKLLLIAILVGTFSSLVAAQRLDLIRVPIAFMAVYFLLKKSCGYFSNQQKIKLYVKYIILGVIVLFIFASVKEVVGRSKNNLNEFQYVAKYISGAIVLFDDYLKNPIKNSDYFGKETFWGIYNFLYLLTKNRKYFYDFTLEFRTIDGTNMGNVYSAFRSFYADFGILGIVIMPAIMGIFFGFLYGYIKSHDHRHLVKFIALKYRISSPIDFAIVIYALIIHSCLFMFYQDWFFSQVLGWYQIKSIIFIWIFKFVFVDIGQPIVNNSCTRET